jgi:hypothetical protein
MLYNASVKKTIKKNNPTKTSNERLKIAGDMWKRLKSENPGEITRFQDMAKEDAVRYATEKEAAPGTYRTEIRTKPNPNASRESVQYRKKNGFDMYKGLRPEVHTKLHSVHEDFMKNATEALRRFRDEGQPRARTQETGSVTGVERNCVLIPDTMPGYKEVCDVLAGRTWVPLTYLDRKAYQRIWNLAQRISDRTEGTSHGLLVRKTTRVSATDTWEIQWN